MNTAISAKKKEEKREEKKKAMSEKFNAFTQSSRSCVKVEVAEVARAHTRTHARTHTNNGPSRVAS